MKDRFSAEVPLRLVWLVTQVTRRWPRSQAWAIHPAVEHASGTVAIFDVWGWRVGRAQVIQGLAGYAESMI